MVSVVSDVWLLKELMANCPMHVCNHTADTKDNMDSTCPGTNFDINHTSNLRPHLSPGMCCPWCLWCLLGGYPKIVCRLCPEQTADSTSTMDSTCVATIHVNVAPSMHALVTIQQTPHGDNFDIHPTSKLRINLCEICPQACATPQSVCGVCGVCGVRCRRRRPSSQLAGATRRASALGCTPGAQAR